VGQPNFLAGVAIHGVVSRSWQLMWGATSDEVARSLLAMTWFHSRPSKPRGPSRSVCRRNRPGPGWSIGVRRAGWYSYDLLDNLGPSGAGQILPEWQHLAPGNVVQMNPDGKHGIEVHSLDYPHTMIWGTLTTPPVSGNSTKRQHKRASSRGSVL
jgi:hypothetical protein